MSEFEALGILVGILSLCAMAIASEVDNLKDRIEKLEKEKE